MSEGSTQLRRFVKARREGMSLTSAAMFAPMSLSEARLTDNDLVQGRLDHIITDTEIPRSINRPATEAAPVQPTIQRESVNRVRVGDAFDAARMDDPASPPQGDTKMARRKKADQVEQVHAPDFALAVRIWRGDIKPAMSGVGEHAQEMSTAYKEIKKKANIQPQAARLAFRLDNMEESKRDDYLRSLKGLLTELKIFMPTDLVDQAEGKTAASEEVIPTGEKKAPKLATLGESAFH